MKDWNIRLKKARENKKLTLKEVTNNINITQQSLIEYEKGNIYPKIDMMVSLCNLYDVSLNFIIYGNEVGIEMDTDMNKAISLFVSLLLTNKIQFENNFFTIKDKKLAKYMNYFLEYYNNNSKLDLEIISTMINAINNIHDEFIK